MKIEFQEVKEGEFIAMTNTKEAREKIKKDLKSIIPEDECNYHLRDTHWIPELIGYIEGKISEGIKLGREEYIKELKATEKKDLKEIEEAVKKRDNMIREELIGEIEEEIIKLKEPLSAIEHIQWMNWSQDLQRNEPNLTQQRVLRWKSLWKDYYELPDDEKKSDREYAELVLRLLRGLLEKIRKDD